MAGRNALSTLLASAWPSYKVRSRRTVELTSKNYTRNDWRKLLSTRRVTIIVAGVCALVAAGILLLAMNRYRHHVDTRANQATDLLAGGVIQTGISGDSRHISQRYTTPLG